MRHGHPALFDLPLVTVSVRRSLTFELFSLLRPSRMGTVLTDRGTIPKFRGWAYGTDYGHGVHGQYAYNKSARLPKLTWL